MVRPVLRAARLARGICTRATSSGAPSPKRMSLSIRPSRAICRQPTAVGRFVSISSRLQKGILPESEDPPPKESESMTVTASPASITENEYHELADDYLDTIMTKLEALQDEKEGIDLEFAAGVLTVSFPSVGTYVINKQPPNKQIWLSSPTSGPKRYDWVILGDGQNQKEGTGAGDWIYLRDKSSLNDLFLDEIGVDLSMPPPNYGE